MVCENNTEMDMGNTKEYVRKLGIGKIVSELEKREKEQDAILGITREIIRHCANGIKLMHSGELKEARKHVLEADRKIAKISKTKEFDYLLTQMYQEIAEAKVLLAAIEKKELPGFVELKMPFEAYLLGLCDAIGEFRREMLEQLKSGNKKEAARYFELMSALYDELSVVRFSNSLLPNFRKKQDVARMQVEQARSEIMRK